MVLEDIITPGLTSELVELIDKNSALVQIYDMRGKQKTQELRDLWSKGLDVLVIKKIKD